VAVREVILDIFSVASGFTACDSDTRSYRVLIVFDRTGAPFFKGHERFEQQLGVLGLVSNSVSYSTALDEVLGLNDVRVADAVVAALLRYLAADSEEGETGELEG
jgi:hypothetical protein